MIANVLLATALLVSPMQDRDPSEGKQRASRSPVMTIKSLPVVWQKLAWCESRWKRDAVSPSGQHYGYFQIHRGWFKGVDLVPEQTTLRQQYWLAQRIYKKQGARAWTCAKQAGLR